MIKRFFAGLSGLLLLGGIVILGVFAYSDSFFIIWFGLATALLSSIIFVLLRYAIIGEGKAISLIKDMGKVPEMEKMILEAKTEAEGLRLLRGERERLIETVRYEVKKKALEERKNMLLKEEQAMLQEMNAINEEINSYNKVDDELSTTQKEIKEMMQRLDQRKNGETLLPIGKVYVNINSLFGSLSYSIINMILPLVSAIVSKKKR